MSAGRVVARPLQTSRLVLRDFVPDDYEAVFAFASHPEVTRFMFYGPRDEAATRDYLARMLESQTADPRVVWELAVVERESNQLIGACDLTLETERDADLGFILGRAWWGRGYATEAARAMVQAGFKDLHVDRVFSLCDVNHVASTRVMEKAGLKRVELVKGAREAKGRSWDMWRYELQRADWRPGAGE